MLGRRSLFAKTISMSVSKEIDHVFAAVLGIADQFATDGIHDEIEHFERNLADESGAVVGDIGDVNCAVATLDGKSHRLVDAAVGDTGRGTNATSADFGQAEFFNPTFGKRQHYCSRIDEGVGDVDGTDQVRGQFAPLHVVEVLQVFNSCGHEDFAHRVSLHFESPAKLPASLCVPVPTLQILPHPHWMSP
jgi:hypothetical protein